LAEQAKILVAEAEENNWDDDRFMPIWRRWHRCSLCEQKYHGVVRGALGWACWKTYVGRPEADLVRYLSLEQLANGLTDADHHEDALSVREAELSMRLRLGDSQENVLIAQGNLAATYVALGRLEEALRMLRDVYSGRLKLSGEEHSETVRAAYNSANALMRLRRFEEAKVLLRKTIPVARRVLRENDHVPLEMRSMYAQALCRDPAGTLDDIREAATMLEETERIARRLLGGAHPVVAGIELSLRNARSVIAACESARETSRERPPTSKSQN